MPSGMEFLLQSLGIDPAQIQATISEVQKQFTLVNDRLSRMETKLDAAIALIPQPGQREDMEKNGDSDSHTGAGAVNGAGAGSTGSGC